MKKILTLGLILLAFLSCTNEEVKKNEIMRKMDASFKIYIRDNDLRKNFITKLKKVKTISYKELTDEDAKQSPEELYEAKVLMVGTTALMNSARVYNLNDTVTCYFNEDLKMLRLVNPND